MLNSLNDALEKYLLRQHCCYIASVISKQQHHFHFSPSFSYCSYNPTPPCRYYFLPLSFPLIIFNFSSFLQITMHRIPNVRKDQVLPAPTRRKSAPRSTRSAESRIHFLPPIPNLILNSHSAYNPSDHRGSTPKPYIPPPPPSTSHNFLPLSAPPSKRLKKTPPREWKYI